MRIIQKKSGILKNKLCIADYTKDFDQENIHDTIKNLKHLKSPFKK